MMLRCKQPTTGCLIITQVAVDAAVGRRVSVNNGINTMESASSLSRVVAAAAVEPERLHG